MVAVLFHALYRRTRATCCMGLLACAVLLAAPPSAQAQEAPEIRTSRAGSYVRLSFSWPTPTRMQVADNGKQVTLRFSNAVPASVTSATAALAPYVLSISRSADGKQVTMVLNDRHRIRHFTSGKNTGLDVLAALKPETKKETSPPAPKNIKPKAAAKSPAPKALLTTKNVKPQAKPQKQQLEKPTILSTKATPKPPVKKAVNASVKEPAPKTIAKPAVTAPTKAVSKKRSAKTTPIDDKKPQRISVGVIPDKKGPTLQFPWKSRTSLAAFTRGNNNWLVFGREAIIDLPRLQRILPSPLVQIRRFTYPGYTALRIHSSEPLYPSVKGSRDSYQLDVKFVKKPTAPINQVDITPGTDREGPHILFKLFDISKPLAFYDPEIGDRWLITPTYSVGKGNEMERLYPGIRVLQTNQGLAINTEDDTVRLKRTRAGLRLTRDGGLALSKNLPFLPGQKNVSGTNSLTKNVVLANSRFFISGSELADMRRDLMNRLVRAVDLNSRAAILHRLAGMYVAKGFGPEASTILTEIRNLYRNYYNKEKLAIMHTAAAFLGGRMQEAAFYLKDDAVANSEEAQLWREAIGLFTNVKEGNVGAGALEKALEEAGLGSRNLDKEAPFDYLAYDAKYLQYYPAPLRQKLSLIAADRYIHQGQSNNALTVFDRLDEDGILTPIQPYAEYLFGKVAADKGNVKSARAIWESLIERDEDRYISARSDFALTTLEYAQGITDLEDTLKRLNRLRLDWRGDELERELLEYLGERYFDASAYDNAMRTWKELLNAFPHHPQTLQIRARMASLFEELFTHGLADKMEPLRSLALFYEFRNLTPIGERGNRMVQKLAERLASVDLLDRAIELLDHQVRKRVNGKERARVGAQLALLQLMNEQPKKALEVLELSNYGDVNDALRRLRLQLNAQALADLKRPMDAINVLRNDRSPKGRQLSLDILWQMQDWPNIITHAEDVLALRDDVTKPLTPQEQETLIQLALAYSFERDFAQLSYLRDFYMNLLPKDSQYSGTFDYLTNDTSPLDTEDVALLSRQISRTRSFLRDLREQVSGGKLSEAVQ